MLGMMNCYVVTDGGHKMSNILNGVMCLVLGAILWLLASVVGGFLAAFGEASLALGYLMFTGAFS